MTEKELVELAQEIRATVKAEVAAAVEPMAKRQGELLAQVGELLGENVALKEQLRVQKERIEAVAKEPRVIINPAAPVMPPVPPSVVHVAAPAPSPRKLRRFDVTQWTEDGRVKRLEEVE